MLRHHVHCVASTQNSDAAPLAARPSPDAVPACRQPASVIRKQATPMGQPLSAQAQVAFGIYAVCSGHRPSPNDDAAFLKVFACVPAESLRQALESRTHTITQGERRGATLRAQADAALDFKFAAGQAQDVAAYAGECPGVATCSSPLRLSGFAQLWSFRLFKQVVVKLCPQGAQGTNDLSRSTQKGGGQTEGVM